MTEGKVYSNLAISGGQKVRMTPFPGRGLIGKEEKDAVDALFDESIRTGNAFGYNGIEEELYCNEFAEFMGGGFADAVNSGTTAVYVALRALCPEPFTEIIVSPITDPGGCMPIVMLNCIPVLADSIPGSFNTGPAQIEELITPLTSAILVSHIGGEPADMIGIMNVAKRYNLPVVEDCSQSHAAKINGQYVGTFGDIAAFSTMFGKHHCVGGQGGIVFTKDEELYKIARRASDRGKPFFLPEGSTNEFVSLNFNLNDLAAVIGRVQIKKLPIIVKKRQEVAIKIIKGLNELKSVYIPEIIDGAEHTYWFYRLGLDVSKLNCDKKTFLDAVIAEGIPINPSYEGALMCNQSWLVNRKAFGTSGYPWASPEYKGDANKKFACPNAVEAAKNCFILSLNESWGDAEVEDTIKAFKKVESVYLK